LYELSRPVIKLIKIAKDIEAIEDIRHDEESNIEVGGALDSNVGGDRGDDVNIDDDEKNGINDNSDNNQAPNYTCNVVGECELCSVFEIVSNNLLRLLTFVSFAVIILTLTC
jgi:hypothetical protein